MNETTCPFGLISGKYSRYHYITSSSAIQDKDTSSAGYNNKIEEHWSKGKQGRPRKHAPKVPLPPLYVFICIWLLIQNNTYNPRVVSWLDEH